MSYISSQFVGKKLIMEFWRSLRVNSPQFEKKYGLSHDIFGTNIEFYENILIILVVIT